MSASPDLGSAARVQHKLCHAIQGGDPRLVEAALAELLQGEPPPPDAVCADLVRALPIAQTSEVVAGALWLLAQWYRDGLLGSADGGDVVPATVHMVRTAPNDPVVLAGCCGVLEAAVAADRQCAHAVAACGGLAAVLAAAQRHLDCESLQERCLVTLGNVAVVDPAFQDQLLEMGMSAVITNNLIRHGGVARVVEVAAACLANVAFNNDAAKGRLVALGVGPRLATAMQAHAGHAPVLERCCQAIRNLASASTREQMGQEGLPECLLAVLQAHPSEPDLQRHAFLAIVSLAVDSPANQQCLVEAGAVPLVLDALQQPARDGALQAEACAGLVQLSYCPAAQESFVRLGGIATLLAVLRQPTAPLRLQRDTLGVLVNVSCSTEAATQMVHTEGLLAEVVRGLGHPPADAELATRGCQLLGNVGRDEAARTIMAEMGCVDAVVAVAQRCPQSPDLLAVAFWALENLSAKHAANQGRVLAGGGVRSAAGALTEFVADPELTTRALRLLACLATAPQRLLEAGGAEELPGVVVRCVVRHSANEPLLRHALGLLAVMSGSAEVQSAISTPDFFAVLEGIMDGCQTSSVIQVRCCRIVGNCSASEARRPFIMTTGLPRRVVAALQQPGATAEVRVTAAWALQLLAADGAERAAALAEAGALSAVADALPPFADQPAVLSHLLALLLALLQPEGNRELFVRQGSLASLVVAMKSQQATRMVFLQLCEATLLLLQNTTLTEVRDHFCSLQLIAALKGAMVTHTEDVEVLATCCEVLHRLQLGHPPSQAQAIEAGVCHDILQALATHRDPAFQPRAVAAVAAAFAAQPMPADHRGPIRDAVLHVVGRSVADSELQLAGLPLLALTLRPPALGRLDVPRAVGTLLEVLAGHLSHELLLTHACECLALLLVHAQPLASQVFLQGDGLPLLLDALGLHLEGNGSFTRHALDVLCATAAAGHPDAVCRPGCVKALADVWLGAMPKPAAEVGAALALLARLAEAHPARFCAAAAGLALPQALWHAMTGSLDVVAVDNACIALAHIACHSRAEVLGLLSDACVVALLSLHTPGTGARLAWLIAGLALWADPPLRQAMGARGCGALLEAALGGREGPLPAPRRGVVARGLRCLRHGDRPGSPPDETGSSAQHGLLRPCGLCQALEAALMGTHDGPRPALLQPAAAAAHLQRQEDLITLQSRAKELDVLLRAAEERLGVAQLALALERQQRREADTRGLGIEEAMRREELLSAAVAGYLCLQLEVQSHALAEGERRGQDLARLLDLKEAVEVELGQQVAVLQHRLQEAGETARAQASALTRQAEEHRAAAAEWQRRLRQAEEALAGAVQRAEEAETEAHRRATELEELQRGWLEGREAAAASHEQQAAELQAALARQAAAGEALAGRAEAAEGRRAEAERRAAEAEAAHHALAEAQAEGAQQQRRAAQQLQEAEGRLALAEGRLREAAQREAELQTRLAEATAAAEQRLEALRRDLEGRGEALRRVEAESERRAVEVEELRREARAGAELLAVERTAHAEEAAQLRAAAQEAAAAAAAQPSGATARLRLVVEELQDRQQQEQAQHQAALQHWQLSIAQLLLQLDRRQALCCQLQGEQASLAAAAEEEAARRREADETLGRLQIHAMEFQGMLEEKERRIQEAEAAAEDLHAELQLLKVQLKAQMAASSEDARRLAALEGPAAEAEALQRCVEELQCQLEGRERRLAAAEAEAWRLAAQQQQAEEALLLLRQECDTTRVAQQSTGAEAQRVAAALREAEARLSAAEAEQRHLTAELAAQRERASAVQAELDDRRSRLETSEDLLQEERSRLLDAVAETARLSARLARWEPGACQAVDVPREQLSSSCREAEEEPKALGSTAAPFPGGVTPDPEPADSLPTAIPAETPAAADADAGAPPALGCRVAPPRTDASTQTDAPRVGSGQRVTTARSATGRLSESPPPETDLFTGTWSSTLSDLSTLELSARQSSAGSRRVQRFRKEAEVVRQHGVDHPNASVGDVIAWSDRTDWEARWREADDGRRQAVRCCHELQALQQRTEAVVEAYRDHVAQLEADASALEQRLALMGNDLGRALNGAQRRQFHDRLEGLQEAKAAAQARCLPLAEAIARAAPQSPPDPPDVSLSPLASPGRPHRDGLLSPREQELERLRWRLILEHAQATVQPAVQLKAAEASHAEALQRLQRHTAELEMYVRLLEAAAAAAVGGQNLHNMRLKAKEIVAADPSLEAALGVRLATHIPAQLGPYVPPAGGADLPKPATLEDAVALIMELRADLALATQRAERQETVSALLRTELGAEAVALELRERRVAERERALAAHQQSLAETSTEMVAMSREVQLHYQSLQRVQQREQEVGRWEQELLAKERALEALGQHGEPSAASGAPNDDAVRDLQRREKQLAKREKAVQKRERAVAQREEEADEDERELAAREEALARRERRLARPDPPVVGGEALSQRGGGQPGGSHGGDGRGGKRGEYRVVQVEAKEASLPQSPMSHSVRVVQCSPRATPPLSPLDARCLAPAEPPGPPAGRLDQESPKIGGLGLSKLAEKRRSHRPGGSRELTPPPANNRSEAEPSHTVGSPLQAWDGPGSRNSDRGTHPP